MGKGRPAYVVIPGIRQVDKRRLLDQIGQAPADLLADVDEALRAYPGD